MKRISEEKFRTALRRPYPALHVTAFDGVLHGDEPWEAAADGVLELVDLAGGAGAAGTGVAWVRFLNTALVLADEAVAAVGVDGALGAAAGDGVGLGDQAWLTPTGQREMTFLWHTSFKLCN